VVPWLSHREGPPIKSFRTAWRAACRRTKLARIPHDFRRTAVRNLARAGVSENVAMELTGHLTRSVFERYNITTDRDRRDAVARLAAAAPDRQVLVLPAANRRVAGG
jgi:integrase